MTKSQTMAHRLTNMLVIFSFITNVSGQSLCIVWVSDKHFLTGFICLNYDLLGLGVKHLFDVH